MSSSDEDTEIQSSPQSPEDGNQSNGIYRRTRSQTAPQRIPHNEPPPTPQLTNDNPLTDLHGRQRAPLKQLRRCFENLTGNESSMSGTRDEEVDYGSCGGSVNPPTDSDHAWSTSEIDN